MPAGIRAGRRGTLLPVPRAATSLLDAELVALRISHHHGITVFALNAGAESGEPPNLIGKPSWRSKVEMHTVLGGLGFRHRYEPHVRATPARSFDVCLRCRRVLVDVGAKCFGPKVGESERIDAVERHGLDEAWHQQRLVRLGHGPGHVASGVGTWARLVPTTQLDYAPNWLVGSADEAADDIRAAGGRVIAEPFDNPVGRVTVVADPFDNVLVLLDLSKGRYGTDHTGSVTVSQQTPPPSP